ncbi:MAG TPA: hypothetical protein DDW50_21150 [Firmicutes bacterium]|jgi:uncharacterized protein|nr:hypothetical protein [Bacillota bacterium]
MKVKAAESSQVNPKLLSRLSSTGSHQASFSDTLRSSDVKRRSEACETILQELDVLGERLKKGPNPSDVKKYRSLIGDFMREASGQSYDIHEESHWDREGNRKNFVLVRKINQSVEELLDAVMNQEKKQIDVVAKLTEIRGLLVDFYL